MQNGVYIYEHTSEIEINYSYLYLSMSKVANWNSRKNFSPSNVHHFLPGKEAGVNVRFNIYTSVNVYGYNEKLILNSWFPFSAFTYCMLISKLDTNHV